MNHNKPSPSSLDALNPTPRRVFISGACGFVGRAVTQHLIGQDWVESVVAADILEPAAGLARLVSGIDHGDATKLEYVKADVRDADFAEIFTTRKITTVVHLAAVVTPRPDQSRQDQYDIDVTGTSRVARACAATGVEQFVYTSSGAAYGYRAEHRSLIREDDPLRGNEVFAYSHHKRLIEEELAELRQSAPQLQQLIFRVSTVLGPHVDNQITAMFERKAVIGLKGVSTPFCFIAVEDVVGAIVHGVTTGQSGIFNLTGDGVMSLKEIAARMGRTYLPLPERGIQTALKLLGVIGKAPYGPEQTLFLKYRPVMNNRRLKQEFGYIPSKTTHEVFESFRHLRSQMSVPKS